MTVNRQSFTTKPVPGRRSDCAFGTPAKAVNPGANGINVNPIFISPIKTALGNTVNRDVDVTPVVSHLHSTGSPFAILRRVVTIVVDAVNSVLVRRPFAHISKEVRKGKPTFAEGYSAPTVVFESFAAGS